MDGLSPEAPDKLNAWGLVRC